MPERTGPSGAGLGGQRPYDPAAWYDRRAAPASPRRSWRPLVEVDHLTKVYEPSPKWMKVLLKSSISEPVTAVADLSLQVWPGQMFAVVGPNGAGKSTLFRVLTGLITPTSGRVSIAGIDVVGDARAARRHIGFMPAEDRSLNLRHTCWQNLVFHGRLQGIPADELRPRIDAVLDVVGLGHVHDRTGHALSSGMRARLQLARALLHEPEILILDEPTGTIDPVGAHDLLQLVQRLAAERQLAVLLSSHRLEEIDALEDNVLFINKGHVVHTGSMDSLRAVMEQPILRLRFDSAASAQSALHHLATGRDLPLSLDGVEVLVGGNASPSVVLPRLGHHLAQLEGVDRSRMPLQELISRLMREELPAAGRPRRTAWGGPAGIDAAAPRADGRAYPRSTRARRPDPAAWGSPAPSVPEAESGVAAPPWAGAATAWRDVPGPPASGREWPPGVPRTPPGPPPGRTGARPPIPPVPPGDGRYRTPRRPRTDGAAPHEGAAVDGVLPARVRANGVDGAGPS